MKVYDFQAQKNLKHRGTDLSSEGMADNKAGLHWNRNRTKRLFHSYRVNGDMEARETIYRDYLKLAEFHARRYLGRGVEYDDLYQEACVGLLTAIKRYDPTREAEFHTYATYFIEGSIKQYFRDKMWPCSVPRSIKNFALRVRDMKRELGHEPTRQEIIEAGIIPLDKIDTVMAAAQAWSPVRLNHGDSPIIINPKIDQSLSYTDSEIDSVSSKIDMQEAVQRILNPDEMKVTFLYFFEELSQREIAESLDTYQMHVSRLLHKATDKLSREFQEESLKAS